jgi:hypothetical protein
MKAILAPLPAEIADVVQQMATPRGRGRATMRYDAPSRKAFWIEHSNQGVMNDVVGCYTFAKVEDHDAAADLWERFENSAPITPEQMIEIYSRVTGIPVESIGTRQ